jgi:hypothetical protein
MTIRFAGLINPDIPLIPPPSSGIKELSPDEVKLVLLARTKRVGVKPTGLPVVDKTLKKSSRPDKKDSDQISSDSTTVY